FFSDLVVYLPITLLLPTFAFRSRYSLAGKKNSGWLSFITGRSRSKSWEDNSLDIRGPVDKVLTNQVKYNPHLTDYSTHEEFGPLLSRLDAYFHYLRVHDDHCRMRAICQLAQDPAAFTPLSHLILSALKKSESFSRPSTYSPVVFRFFRYYWAAERGVAGVDCGHAYSQCPADLEDIVNMSVLNFWQNLASFVSIKLSDE
ncbi:putative DM4/DM12 family-like protein 19, partial [Homarus americanus]